MKLKPTTLEHRLPLYEDVEQFISQGFVVTSVQVGDLSFHLRSLCPGDLFLLKYRSKGQSELSRTVWAIATSIWMINGHYIMDQDVVPGIYQFLYHNCSTKVIERLNDARLGLYARYNRAMETVEAYNYESLSRYRWATRNELFFDVKALGVNSIRAMWTAFNEVEDREKQRRSDWDGFKLVAMTNAPKGITKLESSEEQALAQEKERREDFLDKFYYYRMGVITEKEFRDDKTLTPRFNMPRKAISELETEMKNWIDGVEDAHDKVVREYKEGVIKRADERAERLSRRHGEQGITETVQVVSSLNNQLKGRKLTLGGR